MEKKLGFKEILFRFLGFLGFNVRSSSVNVTLHLNTVIRMLETNQLREQRHCSMIKLDMIQIFEL